MKELLKKSDYILIVVAILLLLGCKEDDDANALPVIANFTFTVDGDTVNFLNTSEQAATFVWDFGDGTSSTEINPTKTYSSGTFRVTLTASNTTGIIATFQDEIVVSIPEDMITFDSGLLTNGDFENGDAPWFGNALNIVTEGDNNVNSAAVNQAGEAFAVNLSQVVEISEGINYMLTFDASTTDEARTMLAGIGLNFAPFTATVSTINLTTDTQTFTLQLRAEDFGAADSRVIFDMGADVGTVIIDNVSLFEGGDGSDTTNADANNNDFAEGDSDGSTCPAMNPENFIVNGNFEADEESPWELLSSTGSTTISTTVSNNCGTNSGRIQTAPTGNPGVKQTRFGIGTILPNTSYVVTFDIRSDANNPITNGALFNAATFSEAAEESGLGAVRHDLVSADTNISTTWTTRTAVFTTANNVDGGLSILLELVGGGATTTGTIFVDNVSLVLDTGQNDDTNDDEETDDNEETNDEGDSDGQGDSDGSTCPAMDSENFIVNGNFEAEDESPWELLSSTGSSTISTTVSSSCGSNSARIQTAPSGNPGVKQTRFGIGTILPNTSYSVTFDIRSDANDPIANGSLFNAATFSEAAEESGLGAVRHDLVLGDTNIPSTWSTRTFTFTTAANVDGGLSLLLELVGGGTTTTGTIFIDNVSLVVQ